MGLENLNKLVEYDAHNADTIVCPGCGEGGGLHQGAVEVFNRQEDASEGTHVKIDCDEVHVDRLMHRNPSARRHGLRIFFRCEHCGDLDLALRVSQHKGLTFLTWSPV